MLGNGRIDYREFTSMMIKKVTEGPKEDELKEAFRSS